MPRRQLGLKVPPSERPHAKPLALLLGAQEEPVHPEGSRLYAPKEMLASMLATIHNERFIIRLVDAIRHSIKEGTFEDLRTETLGRYYARSQAAQT